MFRTEELSLRDNACGDALRIRIDGVPQDVICGSQFRSLRANNLYLEFSTSDQQNSSAKGFLLRYEGKNLCESK